MKATAEETAGHRQQQWWRCAGREYM